MCPRCMLRCHCEYRVTFDLHGAYLSLLLYSSKRQSVLDAFGTEDEEWWIKMEMDDDCDHWCHGWSLWLVTDVWHLECSLVNYIGNIDSQHRLPHVLFYPKLYIALTPLVRHTSPRKQWYSRMHQCEKYKTLEYFIIKLSWQTDMHVHAT